MATLAITLNTQSEILNGFEKRITRFQSELESLRDMQVNLELRPAPKKWNARECFEHLVVMWEEYRPQIEKGLKKGMKRKTKPFRYSLFGTWFANKMKPIESGGMRTARRFEPGNYLSDMHALERLIEVQTEMLTYLRQASSLDIQQIKVHSPASRIIRMNLGDLFNLLLNHQDRHWKQALIAMESV